MQTTEYREKTRRNGTRRATRATRRRAKLSKTQRRAVRRSRRANRKRS